MKPVILDTSIKREIMDGKRKHFKKFSVNCPEYKTGDVLYVQEDWCKNDNPDSELYGKYEYYTDYDGSMCQDLIEWRPPYKMPKEAARLFLKLTSVVIKPPKDLTKEYWWATCEFERVEV